MSCYTCTCIIARWRIILYNALLRPDEIYRYMYSYILLNTFIPLLIWKTTHDLMLHNGAFSHFLMFTHLEYWGQSSNILEPVWTNHTRSCFAGSNLRQLQLAFPRGWAPSFQLKTLLDFVKTSLSHLNPLHEPLTQKVKTIFKFNGLCFWTFFLKWGGKLKILHVHLL